MLKNINALRYLCVKKDRPKISVIIKLLKSTVTSNQNIYRKKSNQKDILTLNSINLIFTKSYNNFIKQSDISERKY